MMRVATGVAIAILAAACGPSEPREAGGAGRVAASPFEPRTVEIVDYWMGLDPQGPIEFTWRLGRQGAATHAFTGVGTLARAHGKTSGPLTVTIPDSAMTAFLRGLAAAPRTPGEYTPKIEHTDDYPELTIRMHTPTGITEFYSASQGDERRPWRVTIDGRHYVSDSPVPAEALKHLLPFLQREELERTLTASHSPLAR
ncbi:MAG: hypothetical protein ACJ8J0_28370 [Longimicrobiaceae bacterium]